MTLFEKADSRCQLGFEKADIVDVNLVVTSEGSRGGGRISRAISTSTWLFTCIRIMKKGKVKTKNEPNGNNDKKYLKAKIQPGGAILPPLLFQAKDQTPQWRSPDKILACS